MLAVRPLRLPRTQRPSVRSLVARANGYTLWAFNPQPPLAYPPRQPSGEDSAVR